MVYRVLKSICKGPAQKKMNKDKVNIFFLGRELDEGSLRECMAKGLQINIKDIEITIPTKAIKEDDLEKILEIVDNDLANWLIVDIFFLFEESDFTEGEAEKYVTKMVKAFATGMGDGIVFIDSMKFKWRSIVNKAIYSTRLDPFVINKLDELQIVIKPKRHLTIWIDNDHIHTLAQTYTSAPAVGRKKYSEQNSATGSDDESNFEESLSYFVDYSKDISNYRNSDYKEFAQTIGNKFKKFLSGQSGVDNYPEDLLNKFLSTPHALSSHGPIHIISEEKKHFSLPFEFIYPDKYPEKMWGFQNPVIHQIPHDSPPDMDLPNGPVQILLIDANAKRAVSPFTLPDESICEKTLGKLKYASVEIQTINKLSKSRERRIRTKIIETRNYDRYDAGKREIRGFNFDIVHFAGHSGIENGQIYLHWPIVGNPANTISLDDFHEFLSGRYPLLLFLSSCQVGQHEALLEMSERIPFIIAHRWPLMDPEGLKFARAFYENISEGITNPAEALRYTKHENSSMRASLSAIFVCGRKSIEQEYH